MSKESGIFSSLFYSITPRKEDTPHQKRVDPTSVLTLALALAFFFSCHPDRSNLRPLDLSPYSIPLTILAPDSAVVQVKDYKIMRDIIITKGPDFNLQLFELISSTDDAAGEKLRQLATIKKAPFFKQVIDEDDTGFVFSTQPDSVTTQYDFRRVKILGEKEIIFQTGLTGEFSLEAVTRMYEAVR